jgi:flagellar biosynthesis/type III secretory pathway protein FliH
MEHNVAAFSFPALDQMRNFATGAQAGGACLAEEARVNEAIQRGYAHGYKEGSAAAEGAMLKAARDAHSEGFAHGQAEGLAEVRRVAQALSQAIEDLNDERAALGAEAEQFCVELALAIAARLVETDTGRAEFVVRAAKAALKVLAPEPATAIFINPADRALAGNDLKGLPLKDNPTLAPGYMRVEAGRLLVESGIDKAFEEIKATVIKVKTRRTRARTGAKTRRAKR